MFHRVNKHPWKKTINGRGKPRLNGITQACPWRRLVRYENVCDACEILNDHKRYLKQSVNAAAYREEEPLSGAGLEELLPLFRVPHGEGDGVDGVLEPGCHEARPLIQLEAQRRKLLFSQLGDERHTNTRSISIRINISIRISIRSGPPGSSAHQVLVCTRTPFSHTCTPTGNLQSTRGA